LETTAAPKSDEDGDNFAPAEEKSAEEKPKEPETPAEETPAPVEFQLTEEDSALLDSLFGAQHVPKILSLHRKAATNPKLKPSELGRLNTVVVNDRDERIKIHLAVRRIFNSQLES
jgi:tRNA pseudouridine13 synthase